MVEFVNNCKNYNPTIPKHRPRRKRTVKKSNHKHEYELYRAYERSHDGRRIYRTIVGYCIWCGKLIHGHDFLVQRGYPDHVTQWYREVDFSKYDFPIIYVKWDSHLNLQQITDPQEVHEMKLKIQEENVNET